MAPGFNQRPEGETSAPPDEQEFVYLDHAASTPPWSQALEIHSKWASSSYANPSSRHSFGQKARASYDDAKEAFCEELGFHDGVFLHQASATEANNLVISSFLNSSSGPIYVGSDVHASLSWVMETHPERCLWIPLTSEGEYQLPPSDGESLVLLNLVSQDIGTHHDRGAWSMLFNHPKVHLHVDAVQAVGKIPLNLDNLPFHSLSFSSHKFGGIKGSAALLLRDRELSPLIRGGSQEHALRAGTENLPALVASLEGYRLSRQRFEDKKDHLLSMRAFLIDGLQTLSHGVLVNEPKEGVPWILNLSFPGFSGTELVAGLSRLNMGVSTSSACHQDVQTPPRAVSALGRNQSEALGSLRISFHPDHTQEELGRFLKALKECLDSLSQSSR